MLKAWISKYLYTYLRRRISVLQLVIACSAFELYIEIILGLAAKVKFEFLKHKSIRKLGEIKYNLFCINEFMKIGFF